MTRAPLLLQVSYAQIAVFHAHLANPFNKWSDAHVNQGFSWRPGSVSFATLEPHGPIALTVTRSAPPDDGSAERTIVVPFSVPAGGDLEIATISASAHMHLAQADYALAFCHGRSPGGAMWARLSFERVVGRVPARIVRADPALRPHTDLVMTAEPA